MEGMKLDSREQQYYAELFQACDVEGSGKITGPKATELFLASGVNPEILKQITEMCGANRLGHFGRSQFYIALKLVALAQAGLPLRLDTVNPGGEIQLPRFISKGSEQALRDRKKSCGEPDSTTTEYSKPSVQGQLPPPPGSKKSHHSRSLSGQYGRGVVPDPGTTNQFSPQSPPTSPANPPKQLFKQHTAPASMALASGLGGANIPSNQTQQQQQQQQHQAALSSSLDSAEAARLLSDSGGGGGGGHVNPAAAAPKQGQENGNWTMFEDDENHVLIGSGMKQNYSSLEPPNFDSSSISSEAESVDDVWAITDEQREYYVNQFKTMQPDLNSVIKGPTAKHFFEKSKLPIVELSKIWQLSDLNCDGALSLEEFCIAMHLVVLRKNDIELPDHLPLSLMPYSALANDEPFAADLPPGSTLKRQTPPSPQQNIAQWTAFKQESPDSSGVSSPAHLANFEFSKPSADPESKIVQPVAMHVKPEVRAGSAEGMDRSRAFSGQMAQVADECDSAVPPEAGDISPQLMKQRSYTESHPVGVELDSSSTGRDLSKYNAPIQGRPRPVLPKKNSAVPAVVLGGLPPPSNPEGSVNDNQSSHSPPTPPPRPPHGRSMSVDVKSVSQLNAPAVPPRISPKEVQATQKSGDAASITSTPENPVNSSPAESSQILPESNQVAAMPTETEGVEEDDSPDRAIKERLASKPAAPLRQVSRDRRDIQMAVRTHKERNAMLTRLNSELNQELQEVMEQRIALEIQLEHLRPFSS